MAQSKTLPYTVGVLLILAGLGGLSKGVLAGALFILAGVIALPIVRAKIRQKRGVELSRWATVTIVVSLLLAGGWVAGSAEEPVNGEGAEPAGIPEDTPSDKATAEVDLIAGPAEDLLPTLDEFGAGWSETGLYDAPNETAFAEVDTESTVRYEIVVHDSVAEASVDYQSRVESVKERGLGTDSLDIGEEAMMYKRTGDLIVIEFREKNVVAFVEYRGGSVLLPERNAKKYAGRLHDAITE